MPIDWDKVNHPNLVFSQYPSRRSTVYGTKGVVACSQPLAAEAGLDILRRGGNAADAAVAVSIALNVTEPSNCGIGGDAFCLFYDSQSKSVKALNGSGRAPQDLNIPFLRNKGLKGNTIPLTDLNSVTVPGAAAAWIDVINTFGNQKVVIRDIFGPAIRLAEEGVPVSEIHSHAWQRSEGLLKSASPDGSAMLLDGKAPLPGQVMRFPDLAKTFREVADKGKDGFYKGRIAEAIVDLISQRGGIMSLDDLASHESSLVDPIRYEYAGEVTVYECPPNGQGLTALMALGLLDTLQNNGTIQPLQTMEHNSVEYLHVLIESLRIAFADTRYYITDPDVEHIPIERLLSQEYLQSRSKLFRTDKVNPELQHGYPEQSSDTVYFCVSDQWGNACSFIQSNYAGFGTGAIPKGCGFTLQNRGSGFSLDEKHPNSLKGGKRPYHTIIPALATRGDELFVAFGVMGGFMQPQGHVQVLLNLLRGFSVQASLDAPRFCISAGIPDAEVRSEDASRAGDINAEVYFEDGIPSAVIAKLKDMGHDTRKVSGLSRSMMGRGQIIQKVESTEGRLVWGAGSDPRGDGHAIIQI